MEYNNDTLIEGEKDGIKWVELLDTVIIFITLGINIIQSFKIHDLQKNIHIQFDNCCEIDISSDDSK